MSTSASASTTPSTGRAFGRFFLPGPTEVLPEILAAQTRPMIGHRGKPAEELVAQMQPGLKRIFRTSRPVYLVASSATGLMEAAVRNCGGTRVLALVNGAFSERFFRIAQACGCEAEALSVPLGQAHDPEQVRAALRRSRFDAVTVVHSETSTGALNPIAELSEVVHASGDAMLLVDSVTGLAATPVESDAWSLDVVLTGSQKALALPPGLALGVVQPAALERARRQPNRGIYFDFIELEQYIQKQQTPNTPALSLLYALAAQVARIDVETIEGRWARHLAMAERTWAWVASMQARGFDLEVLAPAAHRSPAVTCIQVGAGRTGSAIDRAMQERGFTIAPGYGSLKDSTIRIGHMGDHTVAELDVLLAALEEVLGA